MAGYQQYSRLYTPEEVGLKDVDITSSGPASSKGKRLALGDTRAVTVFVTVTVDGAGGAGALALDWQREDEAGDPLGDALPLVTAIATDDAVKAEVSIGGGLTAKAVNGTVGTDADALRVFGTGHFVLRRTTASNATDPEASVHVLTQNRGG